MRDILILGGYGTFGKRIAAGLARHKVSVIIAGRDAAKAHALASQLYGDYPDAHIRAEAMDADAPDFGTHLARLQPGVVINTCGPFQGKDYRIAEACIAQGVHYIDLADARAFVTGITALNVRATQANVCVISGASTVPCLTSSVIDYYKGEFHTLDELRFGIAPGAKTERGLATVQAIVGYAGKPLAKTPGYVGTPYGWQDLYLQHYPDLGWRWMANCDAPDLDLLPAKYGLKSIQFSGGAEVWPLHLGLWAASWLVRLGLPLDLPKHAARLLALSHRFDRYGTDVGGMHILMRGTKANGALHRRRWFLITKNGDGPQVPCVPAILLGKKLASGIALQPGARPCVSLLTLNEYMDELHRFAIRGFKIGKL
jgi:hypothetical protein